MLLNQAEWEETFRGYYQGDTAFCVSMKHHTSLAIGGPADVVVSPADPVSVRNIVLLLGRRNVPFFPLGSGTNVLVADEGIEGVVMNFRAFRRMEVIEEGDGTVDLFVEAGLPLQRLVNFCKGNGFAGVEGLTGIPGTIGGAICGNAGSYGCEIRDVILSVVIMRSDGPLERYEAEDLGFDYRKSNILPSDIVLSANMRFRRDDKSAVADRTEKYFAEKKMTQPIAERSAGCVFKNPGGMPAGKLIDEAGCKGMRSGDIAVSRVHANFFINEGKGTASDYLRLMDMVSEKVKERFNVVLEPEIRVIGKGRS